MVEVQSKGLRWVFFDAARCRGQNCAHNPMPELRAVLGTSTCLEEDVSVWDVQAPSGADTIEL